MYKSVQDCPGLCNIVQKGAAGCAGLLRRAQDFVTSAQKCAKLCAKLCIQIGPFTKTLHYHSCQHLPSLLESQTEQNTKIPKILFITANTVRIHTYIGNYILSRVFCAQ